MNIKKSRIIQIIKEEVQKMAEAEDEGLAPVPLEKPKTWETPSDDLAGVELEIMRLRRQIADLRRKLTKAEERREELASGAREDTEIGGTDYLEKISGLFRK
jgi:hypothetical protein